MIEYLSYKNPKQYGIDCTFKIIPRSYKPYKLMTIYALDNEKNKSIIAALICIKYTDYNSLLKIFSLFRGLYDFSPICISADFDNAQIKALKSCETFIKKPYIICCLFHLSQTIIRKFKQYKIINKNLNKRAYEILYNLEILSFLQINNVEKNFKFLKEIFTETESEIKFMNYYDKYWIKKRHKIFK